MIQLLPNVLSLARLASVPLTVWLIMRDELPAAFWVFVAAGLSDALDGFIAKRFNAESTFGAYLDPLADKALLVGVYVTLTAAGHLPAWLTILVVFRDLLIIGGAIVVQAVTQRLQMQPLVISKVNTALQIALAGTVLADPALGIDLGPLAMVLVWLVAVTTVASGAAYVVTWLKRVSAWEREK